MVRYALLVGVLMAPLPAAVTRVRLVDRSDVLDGRTFGPAGPYERVVARVLFAVDPKLPQNRLIRDIDYAPVNERGLVEFEADLYMLKPRDSAKGNGMVLFEVANRGGKGMLARYNRAAGSLDPQTGAHFGDGLLLEQGYTLAWLGWQFDVPENPQLVRLYAPTATQGGRPITGIIRAEYAPEAKSTTMPLADSNHRPYAVLPSSELRLSMRDAVTGPRRALAATEWRLAANRDAIEMPGGFAPGHLYEAVYQAANPPVSGLGLAGIRDFISFLKYGGPETLLADQRQYLKYSIGVGVSQSGRLLRTLLYFGFNADEKGRKVFDGVLADVAGAGRGSFNQRFAQPSRDGNPFLNTLYPTDLFPFADVTMTDAETGLQDGLLARAEAAKVAPKIFYTNGSYEYWGRDAALIHLTPDGKSDAPLAPETRIYYVAGTQHGPSRFPPSRGAGQYLPNPNDPTPLHRALLFAMRSWIRDGKEPPPSRYPRLAAGELTPPGGVHFPRIPGVETPRRPMTAHHADYGPEFLSEGIISVEPPRLGKPFPVMVPQVDADGNELGGIRLPEIAVPLATYTGWNLRSPDIGAPTEMVNRGGSWMPFALSREARTNAKDPRRSIEVRYQTAEQFLKLVDKACQELVTQGFLLERDAPGLRDRANRIWDYLQGLK